jgi:hypothetical protein
VRITGASATSAVITVAGSNYNVAITANGKTDNYLVAR